MIFYPARRPPAFRVSRPGAAPYVSCPGLARAPTSFPAIQLTPVRRHDTEYGDLSA